MFGNSSIVSMLQSTAGSVTSGASSGNARPDSLFPVIKTVFIPKENEKDLKDVPDEVRAQLKVVPVEHVDQILEQALQLDGPLWTERSVVL